MLAKPITAVLVAVLLTAPAPAQQATLVVLGGDVWTGEPANPWAEAVVVAGERILAVGTRDEALRHVADGVRVIDASDRLVTPGWIDSHVHLFQGGSNLQSVQLRDAVTREDFINRLRDHAAELPAGRWITGGDWDHTLWGGELPTRDWIDRVTPSHPVWIQRLDGHMALANSRALELAGVGDSTPTPAGGAIDRAPDGRVTGLLRDNAMALVDRVVPPPTAAQSLAALRSATAYLLSEGVTSVAHMGSLDELRVLRAAARAGKLRVRVHASTPLGRWRLLVEEVEAHGRGDDWLRCGRVKGFVDGSLGSHTAAFLEPYTDQPGDRGLMVNSREDLHAWIAGADRAGLSVNVHAIGDRAIRVLLDVYERVSRENGPRDRRFRVEHAQHIHPDDIDRFARLGVIASMQPYHAVDDGRWAQRVIGDRRCETTYAFRSLLDSGARLAFGSDWFVAPASPLLGIEAAVHRCTLDGAHPDGWYAQQATTVEEALRAYTLDAAYALGVEDRLGSLTPGKLADLVVVDTPAPDRLRFDPSGSDVLHTIVGGEVAYSRPAE